MVEEVLRPDLQEAFLVTNEADFAYSITGLGRFRVNAFMARGSCGLVFRRVSIGAISLGDLGLPPVLASLAMEPRGLVLVTGPTGSGKTTTLAGMIDHINATKEVHVVTIEDPIEVLHFDKMAMINQREVRVDTEDFVTAMRAAMRQDPDVILVGEMRDHETVKAGLAAAETGHFVMSTLHTTDAAETINRIIDFFPPHEQKQVRSPWPARCADHLPAAGARGRRQGRCVVMEIAVNTGRIADAIADPDKTSTIASSSPRAPTTACRPSTSTWSRSSATASSRSRPPCPPPPRRTTSPSSCAASAWWRSSTDRARSTGRTAQAVVGRAGAWPRRSACRSPATSWPRCAVTTSRSTPPG
jgi:twitching motility protein PilT